MFVEPQVIGQVPRHIAKAPYTMFEARVRRLDLRLTKNVNLTKKVRLQANIDAHNALNSSAIQAINNTFGTNWLSPTQILDPRLLQISAQLPSDPNQG